MTSLQIYLIIVAGLFGLLIGSFLNVVAYRVPARISLLRESRCPHCDSRVRPWQNAPVVSWILLRGRCADCRAPISARYPVIEALTGVAFAAVTWWILGGQLEGSSPWATSVLLVAYLYLASISVVLTLIDLDTHRLPNSIVLPSYVVAVLLLALASLLLDDWTAALRAVVGMAGMYCFYLMLRVVRPHGMGGGDVKLAGLLGLYLGYAGWSELLVGGFAAFILGGLYGVALILMRRAGRKSAIPFGPWMILGAWAGLLSGQRVAAWYIGLFVSA